MRRSIEPEDAKPPILSIKQEDDPFLQDSYMPDILSPGATTQKSDTRSPSLAMTEIESGQFIPDQMEMSRLDEPLARQDTSKLDSKPTTKVTSKRQSTRREYLPEEIPTEYREKPQFSYSHLIATALRAHPEASGISLSEIYKSIQDIFPFYKYCPHGWQNSVRHNLSSNKAFRKISKEGKGWLWGIDEEYFQERERLKKKAAANSMKAKAASAAAAKAKHLQQQEKEQQQLQSQGQQEQRSEHDVQNQRYQPVSYQPQQHYQLHNQQFQQQLKAQQISKDYPLSLPDPATFVPVFQPRVDDDCSADKEPTQSFNPIPRSPIDIEASETQPDDIYFEDDEPDKNGSENHTLENDVKAVSSTACSPRKSFATPIKKERAKTIAELASEIQIDSSNDRLYYSNMTRETYTERKRLNAASETFSGPAASASGKQDSQRPPFPSTSPPHMPPAVATNSIAQNDAILNSPRYQQYYSTSATTPPIPSTRVTTSLPASSNPSNQSAILPPPLGRSTVSVQSMAAGQSTFRMTQAPKLSGPPAQPTQSQLQKQTSVPQMRVNPQIPLGVRETKGQSPGLPRDASSPPAAWQPPLQHSGKFSTTPVPVVSRSGSVSTESKPVSKPVAKPSINANLAHLNFPKDTLRILNLLQEKIKAQMQSSGQPINSAVLTNALAIAISQLTKNSGGGAGGGAAALTNLLKGKNQAQLVSALATAITSAKKPGASGSAKAGSSASSRSQSPSVGHSPAVPSPAGPSSGGPDMVRRSVSPTSSFKLPQSHKSLESPVLGKRHPPVTVPTAISSPASLTSGTLPAHLSSIANFSQSLSRTSAVPKSTSISPPSNSISEGLPPKWSPPQTSVGASASRQAGSPVPPGLPHISKLPTSTPATVTVSSNTNSSSSISDQPFSSREVTPATVTSCAHTTPNTPADKKIQPSISTTSASALPSSALPGSSIPAPSAASKSKAEMIADMLAKASKLTNPTPNIKAALAQLQAHATKLGLKIPENLRNLAASTSSSPGASSNLADKNAAPHNGGVLPATSDPTRKRLAAPSEEDDRKAKIQRTEG